MKINFDRVISVAIFASVIALVGHFYINGEQKESRENYINRITLGQVDANLNVSKNLISVGDTVFECKSNFVYAIGRKMSLSTEIDILKHKMEDAKSCDDREWIQREIWGKEVEVAVLDANAKANRNKFLNIALDKNK